MEDITTYSVMFMAYLKTHPVYASLLDAIPLMIVSMFGAMVDQVNSDRTITARSTMGSIVSAMATGLITSTVSKEYDIKIHIQVLIALCAGLKAKLFITAISDKVLARVRKFNG